MGKRSSKIVWGISYRLGSMSTWAGPCGIHWMRGLPQCMNRDAFIGRPLFYRTRKLAREEAAKHAGVQTRVRKYKMTWEEV